MDFIRLCISRPVGVSVGVLLLVLFGLLALFAIPVQLTPNVDIPIVKVETRWSGASPQEVEREIIEPQEEKLRSVKGLREMRSTCRDNQGTIELEFYTGVDKDVALRDVADKLRQVPEYPPDVDEPTVAAADSAEDSPIAWIMLRAPEGEDQRLPQLFNFAEDSIKPYLDRVEGVASTSVYGGREREIQVRVDAGDLAARGLTFRQLEDALRAQNANLSAGTVEQGKRDYSVRTIGQYENTEEILDTVVAYTAGGPVYVRDVADVVASFEKQRAFVRSKGQFVLAFPVRREVGANVIEVMEGVNQAVRAVNQEVLEARDMNLDLVQVYDETVYIHQAINMVLTNMVIGGALAVTVLMLFLRNWRATAVVALSIPISVIGTFLLVASLGRTVNVISLAGMAFAIGMVVDAAIVVLENIYRHFQLGEKPAEAAYIGTREVWGAVLASTLTTMAVFVPVILVREEAGQLFRDISVATVAAVGLSLIVSLTVIPTMATRFLAIGDARAAAESSARKTETTGRFAALVSRLVGNLNEHRILRGVAIVGTVVACFGLIRFFIPETTYLPSGNRNLVFGFLVTPPGYSIDEFKRMAGVIEQRLAPYWEVEAGSPEQEQLDEQWRQMVDQMIANDQIPELIRDPNEPPSLTGWLRRDRLEREWRTPPPLIDNFFFVTFGGGCFMGCSSRDEQRVKPLVRLLQTAGGQIPGVYPIFQQTQIFRIGGGNTADIQLRGDDLDKVVAAAGAMFGACSQAFDATPRAQPANFNMGRPEVQILPDRERAADLGLNVRDVGFIVEACVEGAYVGDFRLAGGDTIDIRLKVRGQNERPTQAIGQVPIYTPAGQIVPLTSAVRLLDTTALEQINRVERQRAVTLTINPPETMSLESVIRTVKDELEPQLRQSGAIDPGVTVALTGNADKLVAARNTMIGEWVGFNLQSLLNIISSRFFLSVVIVYLVMAALFESWVYPFVIMFSVPLAIFGGFVGLSVAHWGTLLTTDQPIQQLDVVTFLGFVILVGIVVNNAILLVHQTLLNVREANMETHRAIREAVRVRVRPVLMTSLTTFFGQLPLALIAGSGSELYRGLAAVMLGGLIVAALGTLVIVPSVLGVVFDTQSRLARVFGAAVSPKPVPRDK